MPKIYGETSLVDFGVGPGTALFALADSTIHKINHYGLEIAEGMRAVCEDARTFLAHRIGKSVDHALPGKGFWNEVANASVSQNCVLMFSYFFGQKLGFPFVKALASAIKSVQGKKMTIVYSNPVGPYDSWMPCNDIHHWYRQFCQELGHNPKLEVAGYSYVALANLSEQTNRKGECAYEVWSLE